MKKLTFIIYERCPTKDDTERVTKLQMGSSLKACFSLTAVSNMEVPSRPSSFTLALHKPASSAVSPLGAVATDHREQQLQEQGDAVGEETFGAEEELDAYEEAPGPINVSQDRCSEERSEEDAEEAQKKCDEEDASAKERAAQRQMLAIEELVQSERNYLRLLQLSTGTIRGNLRKLQV